MSYEYFLAASLLTIIFSILLFRRVIGSFDLKKINMISWIFYYSLIGQTFIASILVILKLDEHYVISRVSDDARLYGWLVVQYTMVALPLGMILGQMMFGLKSNKKIFQSYINLPISGSVSEGDSSIKIVLYFLSFLSISSVAYTLMLLPTNPLFAAFSGFDALALAGLRQEASREFAGNVYVRNIFAIGLTPVMTYIAYSYWKKDRKLLDGAWFILMFIAAFFILTYDLSKSPFVIFLVGFLFLNVVVNGGVSARVFNYFIVVAFVLIVGAYYLVMDVMDVMDFSVLFSFRTGIGGRVFFGQAAGTYFAFEHFPRTENFIGFGSLSSFLSGVNGGYSERMARILMTIFNPEAVENGLAGVMNTLFMAEAWANFGLVGVILAPFYVGLVVQALFTYFLKSKKTPIKLGLLANCSLGIPIMGGFNDFIYNPGALLIASIFGLVLLMGYIFKFGFKAV